MSFFVPHNLSYGSIDQCVLNQQQKQPNNKPKIQHCYCFVLVKAYSTDLNVFLQQIKKGLLTLVVRTSLRVGALCGQAQVAQLCRSRSLSSTTGMARVSADMGDYNYLSNTCGNTLSVPGQPAKPRDRVMMEIVLQKGQVSLKRTVQTP